MNDARWPQDFDPTDPDLADETCQVCGEPASYAITLDARSRSEFATMLMLCKVCEHYVASENLDSLIARSPDASADNDRFAEALITHREQAIAFDLGPGFDSPDSWD